VSYNSSYHIPLPKVTDPIHMAMSYLFTSLELAQSRNHPFRFIEGVNFVAHFSSFGWGGGEG
jgi:hypothetical protein